MYTCMYIHTYIHAKVHTFKYGTRKNGWTTDWPMPISDQELAVYGPVWCHHTQVLDDGWVTDRNKLTTDGISHHNWCKGRWDLRQPVGCCDALLDHTQFNQYVDDSHVSVTSRQKKWWPRQGCTNMWYEYCPVTRSQRRVLGTMHRSLKLKAYKW